jgi:hypothetical protein
VSYCNNLKRVTLIPLNRGYKVFVTVSVCSGFLVVSALLTSCQTGPHSAAAAKLTIEPSVAPSAIPEPAVPDQSVNDVALMQKAERIRSACIHGRRNICGRVLQIVPGGLVVDSGYTDLLRPGLAHSWVLPSSVSVRRPPNLVEEKSPGSVCIGLVFVTAIAKRPAVKLYDYVVVQGYPAGKYAYAPVPNVNKTIRKFSVELSAATQLNINSPDQAE